MRWLVLLMVTFLSGCEIYSNDLLFQEGQRAKNAIPVGFYKGCDSGGFCYFFQITQRSGQAYYAKLGLPADEGELRFYQENGNDTALIAIRRPGNGWQYTMYRPKEKEFFEFKPSTIDGAWWKEIEESGAKLDLKTWRDKTFVSTVEVRTSSALMKIYRSLSLVPSTELKSKFGFRSHLISTSSPNEFKASEDARLRRSDDVDKKEFAEWDHRLMVINASMNSYRDTFPSRVTISGPTTATYGHPILGPLYRITFDAKNVKCQYVRAKIFDCKWDQKISIQPEHELAAVAQISAPLPTNEFLEQRIFGPKDLNLNFASSGLTESYRSRFLSTNSNGAPASANSEDAFDRSIRESERINCAQAIGTPGPVGEVGRGLNCR